MSKNTSNTNNNKCPKCGYVLLPNAQFCVKCGSKLSEQCPQCGAELVPDADYCIKCGATVRHSTAAAPKTAAPSETKTSDTAALDTDKSHCQKKTSASSESQTGPEADKLSAQPDSAATWKELERGQQQISRGLDQSLRDFDKAQQESNRANKEAKRRAWEETADAAAAENAVLSQTPAAHDDANQKRPTDTTSADTVSQPEVNRQSTISSYYQRISESQATQPQPDSDHVPPQVAEAMPKSTAVKIASNKPRSKNIATNIVLAIILGLAILYILHLYSLQNSLQTEIAIRQNRIAGHQSKVDDFLNKHKSNFQHYNDITTKVNNLLKATSELNTKTNDLNTKIKYLPQVPTNLLLEYQIPQQDKVLTIDDTLRYSKRLLGRTITVQGTACTRARPAQGRYDDYNTDHFLLNCDGGFIADALIIAARPEDLSILEGDRIHIKGRLDRCPDVYKLDYLHRFNGLILYPIDVKIINK